MPAFKQRLAGGVEIERDGLLVEKGIQPDIRALCIDAGSSVSGGDELIADCVFDPEGEKVQAGEGTTARADLDFDGLRWCKPFGPGERIGCTVDILFGAIGAVTDFPEDTAGDVRLQIHPIHGRPGGCKTDTAFCLGRRRDAEAMEFCFEHAFEPARAGCKEPSFCAIHAYCIVVREALFVPRFTTYVSRDTSSI